MCYQAGSPRNGNVLRNKYLFQAEEENQLGLILKIRIRTHSTTKLECSGKSGKSKRSKTTITEQSIEKQIVKTCGGKETIQGA